jgi:aspartate kinase
MAITVFKFGGASVRDAASVKNVLTLLQKQRFEKLVLIISAMGKTTNALEQLFYAFVEGKNITSFYEQVYSYHLHLISELFDKTKDEKLYTSLDALFSSLLEKLHQPYDGQFNKWYDQIVHYGELFSSLILYHYLLKQGLNVAFLSALDCIYTDNAFREGNVQWEKTCEAIRHFVLPAFELHDIVISQGFIGQSESGDPITLGREGSDYTAAIFAYALDADSLTIWKDVPGVMNADPKRIPQAVPIPHLSYKETVELAYYGASVIHPKTLKPLQNKKIPLYVRSFIDPSLPGTRIDEHPDEIYLPFYIIKSNQVLMSFFPKDFSFVDESNLSAIFDVLARHHVKIRLMENTALSFSICFDYDPFKLDFILKELSLKFTIKYNHPLELITVRHYQPEMTLEHLIKNRKIYLEQKTRVTWHILVKEV